MEKQAILDTIAARANEARQIADGAAARGGFTEDERSRVKAIHAEAMRLRTDLGDMEMMAELQSLGGGLAHGIPGPAGPTHAWAKAITQYHENLLGMGRKDFLTPAGSVVVALPAPAVVQQTSPVRRMRQLVTTEDAPGGHFSYLEQTTRDWAAEAVEPGQEKPVSTFGLERREGQAPVVATVSEPIDRFLLSDAPALNQFVGSELQAAVEHAIEAAAIAELAAADLEAVAFTVDALTTLRRGIGALEELGVSASAVVTNPADWEGIETARFDPGGATGGWQLEPTAPLDLTARRAWGVPILTTTACPAGRAYVGDWAYARFFSPERGRVALDWSEAMGFTANTVTFRAESRVKLALLLIPAFVSVALAATPPVSGGMNGGSGGVEGASGPAPAQGATKKATS